MKNAENNQNTPQGEQAQGYIYCARFNEPPIQGDQRTEFYFHSLAAIYDLFTPEHVGCKVTRLWNIGVAQGEPYTGAKCSISREPILRKRHKRPLSPEE